MELELCNKPTANGLPCALPIGHGGDCKRAAQVVTGEYVSTPQELEELKQRNTIVHRNNPQGFTRTKKRG